MFPWTLCGVLRLQLLLLLLYVNLQKLSASPRPPPPDESAKNKTRGKKITPPTRLARLRHANLPRPNKQPPGSTSTDTLRQKQKDKRAATRLGGLEHLLPVGLIFNVLTPVAHGFCRLQSRKTNIITSSCVISGTKLWLLLLLLLFLFSIKHHGLPQWAEFAQFSSFDPNTDNREFKDGGRLFWRSLREICDFKLNYSGTQ